jgi:hypothetical protein
VLTPDKAEQACAQRRKKGRGCTPALSSIGVRPLLRELRGGCDLLATLAVQGSQEGYHILLLLCSEFQGNHRIIQVRILDPALVVEIDDLFQRRKSTVTFRPKTSRKSWRYPSICLILAAGSSLSMNPCSTGLMKGPTDWSSNVSARLSQNRTLL